MCDHRVAIDPQTRERVCVRCGLILGPTFSPLPERNSDDEDSSFRRACDLATSVRRHDRNLGTEIYRLPKSSKVSPRTRRWWNRVYGYLGRRSATERRLIEFLCDIDRVCGYLGLPRGVKDDLSYAAHKLVGRMRGVSRLWSLMLMTYLSSRRHGADRGIGEIDLAFRELFGDDYAKVRDARLDQAKDVSELGEATKARVQELERLLGYELRLNT